MGKINVHKGDDFIVMGKHHLHNKKLSLKAKGLLSLMLSLPPDWDYTVEGLVKIVKDGRTSVVAAMKELEDCGYLYREEKHGQNGKWEYDYHIYGKPHMNNPLTSEPLTEKPLTEKPLTEKPTAEKPTAENQRQYNTHESSTHESSTQEFKTQEYMNHLSACAEKSRELTDAKQIFEMFNDICVSLPRVKMMSDSRKAAIKNLSGIINGDFETLFRKTEQSDFLTGRNGKWKGASFDWCIKKANAIKILEGNYDNRNTGSEYDYSGVLHDEYI